MEKEIEQLIDLALQEDLQEAGDVTCAAIFHDETVRARLVSKSTGILAGGEVFGAVFTRLDPATRVTLTLADGSALSPGQEAAVVEGTARSVLGGERTALNFIRFITAIATLTRQYVDEAGKYGSTLVLDTRKTLPGFRVLSKYAVRVGGGRNHRQGLFDMVLIKDNHIDAAGSLRRAVERVRARWGDRFKIETECRSLDEVKEAVDLGVDIIMLDNMEVSAVKRSIELVQGRVPVEISGNVRIDRLKDLVPLGADFISVGALTHSAGCFDFSLEVGVR